jgi:RHS repeat-associated protein
MSTENNRTASESGSKNSVAYPLDRYTVQPQQSEGQDKSPYYKSQAPQISLPKGGGALKGIDEKFNVNAVNGTAGLEVPFPLSPGRGGFTPALSLSYSSGAGNSEFGMGWGMSLPSIHRKTDRRLPRYNDVEESDVFLLAGAEDLLPELDEEGVPVSIVSDEYTIRRYRPRIEGLFARIEWICKNDGNSWWRVCTKDNILTYYGLTTAARIADPLSANRVFKWLPELVVDHKGNAQQYYYLAENKDNIVAAPHEHQRLNDAAPFTNTYLKRVAYCNLQPFFVDSPGYEPELYEDTFLMEAVLDYGDHDAEMPVFTPSQDWEARSDAFSDYRAGFEIRTYRRCRRVLMFHRFRELNEDNSLNPVLVRSLDLTYLTDVAPSDPPSPEDHAGIDYITRMTQKGYYYNDAAELISKSLPAMELSYQPIVWDHTVHTVDPDDVANAPQGLTGNYQWTDFFGEGIPGILSEQGNAWWYKRNLGDGHFTHALNLAPKPSFAGLGSNLQWQDLDADGRRQIVSYDPSAPGYFEATLPAADDVDGIQEWEAFRAFTNTLNVDMNSPFNKMLDLDGDGRPDLLLCEDRVVTWYRNEGKEGFTTGGNVSAAVDEDKGPRLLLNDQVQSVFLADMSGDGLTDLVRIRNGEVCYWPNLGYGRFGARVVMSNAPAFDSPDLFNPIYLYLNDVTGTGATDILYLGPGKCTAYINRSGNGFSEAVNLLSLPGVDPQSKITVIDFLGNGTGCVVWSSPLPQYSNAPLRYIDLMGGKKPHLMTQYANGMGKLVALEYKSSTHFYLQDRKEGTPWATKLPFPVHCLHRITTSDEVSETEYVQNYRYRHGYYDHAEREFRGFGRVDTVDIETAVTEDDGSDPSEQLNQDPVLTKSWYHTGAWILEESLTDAFKREYFLPEGWKQIEEYVLLEEGLSAKEQREALRALKGSPLRQEVYALDGSAKEGIPYAVTSFAYEVSCLQHLFDRAANGNGTYPNAVFHSKPLEKLTHSCERFVEDPRVAHEITLETDEYGNVLQSVQIVYPRIDAPAFLPTVVRDEQERMHITYQRNECTNDIVAEEMHYRLRVPWYTLNCELYIPAAGYPDPDQRFTRQDVLDLLPGSVSDYTTPMSGSSRLLRKIGATKIIFRSDDGSSVNLPGKIDPLGLPDNQYTLAFSDDITDTRFDSTRLGEGAYTDLDSDGNFWLSGGTAVYSIDPGADFYSIQAYTDPWSNTTTVSYWDDAAEQYWLLPKETTDALSNTVTVNRYDWRILQPMQVTDMNLNVSEIVYDALGMPVAMAVKGKNDPMAPEGDNLDGLDIEDTDVQADFWTDPQTYAATLLGNATMRCIYDLNTQPTAVAMIGRELHHADGAGAGNILIRISYTDGLGRVAMHKVQAADDPDTSDPRWIGSGKTVYNNKGKAVMQYEPYFSASAAYDPAEQAANLGVSSQMHYDPLGRVRRTDMPDGTFSYTIWDSWTQAVYDANDCCLSSDWYAAYSAGTTEQRDAATKAAAHSDTPTISCMDSLARPFFTIQLLEGMSITEGDEGLEFDLTGVDYIQSYEALDIQGNRLAVRDGRGNRALEYDYNLIKVPMRQRSVDSGEQFMLADAAGNPLYAWDPDNREFHFVYDELRRPIGRFLKIASTNYRIEETIYGEGMTGDTDKNLRGQVHTHRDNAGESRVSEYDFKGLPKETQQQLLLDFRLVHVDWTSSPTLDSEIFISAVVFDALGRPISSSDPGMNLTENFYDKGGALCEVKLTPNGGSQTTYISDIQYDAKGQRLAIWYGNGTRTAYTYDPNNFRLQRLLTSKFGNIFYQDLNYWYDAVGNITWVTDNAQENLYYYPPPGSPLSDAKRYTYDTLYRLIQATGLERQGTASFGSSDNTDDAPWMAVHPMDPSAMQTYTQNYLYDAVGNILQLQHIGATAGSYTRNYAYGSGNSKLNSTQIGATNYPYTYDSRGNMITMPHLSTMDWNGLNELQHTDNGTVETYFNYSGGQRIRKVCLKAGGIEEHRIYLGSYEIYRKFVSSSLTQERLTVHVSDDMGRIAMVETETTPTPDTRIRYIYANHLQSATLELDDSCAIISYEEYHPFGTTAFQSSDAAINAVAKRYRYTGKERDEETGLYYHGARYYIPWLGRWSAVDPEENKNSGVSPYGYCSNNPTSKIDTDGRDDIHFFRFNVVAKVPDGNGGFKKVIVESHTWVNVVKNGKPNTYTDHYGEKNLSDSSGNRNTTKVLENKMGDNVIGKKISENWDQLRHFYPNKVMAPGQRDSENRNEVFRLKANYEWKSKERQEQIGGAMLMVDLLTFGESVILLNALLEKGLTKSLRSILTMRGTASEEGRFLYRFDRRSPSEIEKAGGFSAWGDNEDLFEHVMGFSTATGDRTSAFIATSKNELLLIEELPEGAEGYLYKIKDRGIGVDISKSTDWRLEGKFINENEMAIKSRIDINDIVDVKPIKK